MLGFKLILASKKGPNGLVLCGPSYNNFMNE